MTAKMVDPTRRQTRRSVFGQVRVDSNFIGGPQKGELRGPPSKKNGKPTRPDRLRPFFHLHRQHTFSVKRLQVKRGAERVRGPNEE